MNVENYSGYVLQTSALIDLILNILGSEKWARNWTGMDSTYDRTTGVNPNEERIEYGD